MKVNVYFITEWLSLDIELVLRGQRFDWDGFVYVNGKKVCSDGWTETNAKVVCKQLGYSQLMATGTGMIS